VCVLFDDKFIAHDKNNASILNHRQPMSNGDSSSTCINALGMFYYVLQVGHADCSLIQGILCNAFGLCVQSTSCLVQK
jgi:hypothetical protein